MNRWDWTCFGLCVVWLLAVVWASLGASPAVLQVVSGEHAADWFAATGTSAAVIVALAVAVLDGIRARRLATEVRAEQERQIRHSDIRLLKAMLLTFSNGVESARRVFDLMKRSPERRAFAARAAIESDLNAVVTRCLDDIGIHQLPSTSAVDQLMAARAAWADILDRYKAMAEDVHVQFGVSSDMTNLGAANRILEAMADEIVRRGGEADPHEDELVSVQIRQAVLRSRQAWLANNSRMR